MADRRTAWLYCRALAGVDYWLTLAGLRILDAGPLPETTADQGRERERERLERVFPEIEP